MFGNRVLLKWKEPRFAEKHILSQLTATDYLAAYAKFIWKLALGTFIVFSFLRWISPRSNYAFFDLEILSVVGFIVISVTFIWLLMVLAKRASDPEVSLREKDIFIISADGGFNLKYKDIESCSIGKTEINSQEVYFLEITHYDGNKSFIEIDPKINHQEILRVLKSRNIQTKQSLLNPL